MQGLMFNLLNDMAHESGCTEEAWELLLEFAAAERAMIEEATDYREPSEADSPSLVAYQVPAEAMLRCMKRSEERSEDGEWDDAESVCFHDIPVPDPMQEVFGPGYDALPKCGFKHDAFCSTGLDQATLPPADMEPEDDLDDWVSSLFPTSPPRR